MKKAIQFFLTLPIILTTACSDTDKKAADTPAVTEASTPPGTGPSNLEQVPAPTPADTANTGNRFAEWAGKWTGPEGMFVDIKSTGAGQFQLEMQSDLDTKGSYTGTVDERGIRFTRNGEKLLLYRTSGDETGLKYLAGKKECLMVKSGEGYCRD